MFDALYSNLYGLFRETVYPLAWQYFIFIAPVFAAIFLAKMFWTQWVAYVQRKFFLGLKYTLLDLRLPRDLYKSPLAMETVLHAIHNTSDGSQFVQYWAGETRPWYSLEIISIEGQIKFLMWTEDRRKSNLKSALYSQYPGIEIHEMPDDYARDIQWDPKLWKIWASEFAFTAKPVKARKEDKDQSEGMADVYPIRTYIDYGLDKDPKEEYKVDPLVHVLEWMGSLRPNEQAWFQFVIRAHKDDQKHEGHLWKRHDKWQDKTKLEINRLLMRDPKSRVAGEINPETGFAKLPTMSKGEQEVVAAIERKAQKLPFDVCVRTLYIAKRDVFDTPFGIGGCISSMKQFNSNHLNGFKPGGKMMPGSFDYPWQDFDNVRRNYYSRRVLMMYRRRAAFYPPFKVKTMVMNTEEIATIFHLPGQVASTPTLKRIPSKKSEAPTNLPI